MILNESILWHDSRFGGEIGGEGVFAKVEIPSGTVFAYFGGNRFVKLTKLVVY